MLFVDSNSVIGQYFLLNSLMKENVYGDLIVPTFLGHPIYYNSYLQ